MKTQFLGRIPFLQALAHEREAFKRAVDGESTILGFESERVVTFGVRARVDVDLAVSESTLKREGYALVQVDRGGQATLHNPGQLVIFPVVHVRERGARAWVCGLAKATRDCVNDFGAEGHWDEGRPGIYTGNGKIASIGVRIRQGVSTHGVAINVHNVLSDFAVIRPCGIENAPMDRLGEGIELPNVFAAWIEHFRRHWTDSFTQG